MSSALLDAIRAGKIELVKRALDCDTNTALNLSTVLDALKANSEQLEQRGRGLVTPDALQEHLTASKRHFTKLLGSRTSADTRGALQLAAQLGQMDSATLLLLKGAAVDEVDDLGRTAMHFACLGTACSSSSTLYACLCPRFCVCVCPCTCVAGFDTPAPRRRKSSGGCFPVAHGRRAPRRLRLDTHVSIPHCRHARASGACQVYPAIERLDWQFVDCCCCAVFCSNTRWRRTRKIRTAGLRCTLRASWATSAPCAPCC